LEPIFHLTEFEQLQLGCLQFTVEQQQLNDVAFVRGSHLRNHAVGHEHYE
jgi:hypothetical protein